MSTRLERRRLKINTESCLKFERDMSKTNEDIARALQSRRIVQTLMYDGGKFGHHTIQKSVKFRDFVEKYVRSLLTYYI